MEYTLEASFGQAFVVSEKFDNTLIKGTDVTVNQDAIGPVLLTVD